MSDKQIDITIKAWDEYSRTFARFSDDTETLKQKIKSLDDTLGDRSNFGKIQKALMGGGAIGGLALAGRALDDLTRKALELKDAFQSGEKSAADVADELARSLPILGKIYSAGRNINELLLGTKAEMKEMLAIEEQFANSLNEGTKKLFEMARKNFAGETGFEDDLEKWKAQIERLSLDGLALDEFDIKLKLKVDKDALDDELAKQIADEEKKARGDGEKPAANSILGMQNQAREFRDKADKLEAQNDSFWEGDRQSIEDAKRQMADLRAKAKDLDDLAAANEAELQKRLKTIRDGAASAMVEREKLAASEIEKVREKSAESGGSIAGKAFDQLEKSMLEFDEAVLQAQRDEIRSHLDGVARAELEAQEKLERVMKAIREDRAKLENDFEAGRVDWSEAENKKAGFAERENIARKQAGETVSDAKARNLDDAKSVLDEADRMALESRSAAGDRFAKQQLERLNIEDKYLSIQKELAAISEDLANDEMTRTRARLASIDLEASKQRELAGIEKKRADDAIDNLKRMRDADEGFDATEAGAGFASRIAQQLLLSRSVKTDFPTAPTDQPQAAPEIPGPPASVASNQSSTGAPPPTTPSQQPMTQQQGADIVRLLGEVLTEFKNTTFLTTDSSS